MQGLFYLQYYNTSATLISRICKEQEKAKCYVKVVMKKGLSRLIPLVNLKPPL